jgi:hypothetical protein
LDLRSKIPKRWLKAWEIARQNRMAGALWNSFLLPGRISKD